VIHRLVLSVVVAAAFGTAVPAAGVSLPVVPEGVEVDGIQVGGLISVAAQSRLAERFGQPITFFLGNESWSVAPGRLGASAAIKEAVSRALGASPGTSVDLRIAVRPAAVRRYVDRLDKRFARPARSAELVGLTNGLTPAFTRARPGRKVDKPVMVRRITRALQSTWRGAQLQVKLVPVEPRVTADDYGSIIVIRRGSNRLNLYDGTRSVRTFTVATGQDQYPTPLGNFEIVVKERDPTWNPPDSEWAQDAEPIPPGPGNPLGTRWMGLSAYAVGIHGTPDPASLGYSVSHGCIRMAIPEAEWLFDHVEVGTPVYIVSA
jgi:lipoprotein-anchoring transpeptidase ErfK/SrfK